MQKENLTLRKDGGLELMKNYGLFGGHESSYSGLEKCGEATIAVDENGNYVITWSEFDPNSSYNIFAQRFRSDGTRLGNKIMVCTEKANQINPNIMMDAQGRFIISWMDHRSGYYKIYYQAYDSNGNKVGSELKITNAPNNQGGHSTARDSLGRVIITWSEDKGSTNRDDIMFRTIDIKGSWIGDIVEVTNETKDQFNSGICAAPNGNIMVAWIGEFIDANGNSSLYAKWYDSTGKIIQDTKMVSDNTTGNTNPVIKVNSKGEFNIVWSKFVNSNQTIFFKRYTSSGVELCAETAVSKERGNQDWPDMVIDSKDDMIIVYQDDSNGMYLDLYARKYDANGIALTGEIPITTTIGNHSYPALTVNAHDELMIVWTSYDSSEIRWNRFAGAYCGSGKLITYPITVPANFTAWTNISANVTYCNLSANSVPFDYSTDDGLSWSSVASNGSLDQVIMTGPLRFRVNFASTDNMSSPILYALTLNYWTNISINNPPTVFANPDVTIYRNSVIELGANGTDPDGDPLSFTWERMDNLTAGIRILQVQHFSFSSNRSGNYSFRVYSNDGICNSSFAYVNVTVINRPPIISISPEIIGYQNKRISIRANATDPDGDNLTYRWGTLSKDPWAQGLYIIHMGDPSGPDLDYMAAKSGRFSYLVYAEDGESQSDTLYFNVTIKPVSDTIASDKSPMPVIVILIVMACIAVALMAYRKKGK
jgi:hypothetical protein